MSENTKRKILIQLDHDPQASSFDRVVAIDGGADVLFSYGNVQLEQVEALVHGAIFTRGPAELKNTAIFIGGSDVEIGEKMLHAVSRTFFGPFRVSVMMDANGSNTTAAAAVLAARKHVDLSKTTALILAGTGPVGQRAARLLSGEGAKVRLASRSASRAEKAAIAVNQILCNDNVSPWETSDDKKLLAALEGVEVVIAAGAAGVRLLPKAHLVQAKKLKVAIDLNAVPPQGIEGIEVADKAKAIADTQVVGYGAIGVGGTKMKIHKAAIASLFTSSEKVFDAEAIYALGKSL